MTFSVLCTHFESKYWILWCCDNLKIFEKEGPAPPPPIVETCFIDELQLRTHFESKYWILWCLWQCENFWKKGPGTLKLVKSLTYFSKCSKCHIFLPVCGCVRIRSYARYETTCWCWCFKYAHLSTLLAQTGM